MNKADLQTITSSSEVYSHHAGADIKINLSVIDIGEVALIFDIVLYNRFYYLTFKHFLFFQRCNLEVFRFYQQNTFRRKQLTFIPRCVSWICDMVAQLDLDSVKVTPSYVKHNEKDLTIRELISCVTC